LSSQIGKPFKAGQYRKKKVDEIVGLARKDPAIIKRNQELSPGCRFYSVVKNTKTGKKECLSYSPGTTKGSDVPADNNKNEGQTHYFRCAMIINRSEVEASNGFKSKLPKV
jgi:hypothetical protein